MNKSKFFLLSVMAFYIATGVLACTFFFFRDSSLSGNVAAAPPETLKSLPVSAGVLQETAGILLEPVYVAPETEHVYYTFTTLTTRSALHVRQEPSMNAQIIAWLPPGTTGYVLERGPVWSLIQSGSITGYAFNEYLEFCEIPEEEYPFL